MTLALALGKTLAEVAQMSAYEFALWAEYNETSPIDPNFRADVRTAAVQKAIADWAGKELRKGAKTKLEDFMFDWRRRSEEDEEEEADPVAHFTAVAETMRSRMH